MDWFTCWLLEMMRSIVEGARDNGNDVSRLVEGIESYNLFAKENGRQPFSRSNKDIIVRYGWFDDFVGKCFKLIERDSLIYRFVYSTEVLEKVVALHVLHLHVNVGRNASWSIGDHAIPAEVLRHCGSIDPMELEPGGKKEVQEMIKIILEAGCRTKLLLRDFGIHYNAIHEILGWFTRPIPFPTVPLHLCT